MAKHVNLGISPTSMDLGAATWWHYLPGDRQSVAAHELLRDNVHTWLKLCVSKPKHGT
jgi:hypothetical protein